MGFSSEIQAYLSDLPEAVLVFAINAEENLVFEYANASCSLFTEVESLKEFSDLVAFCAEEDRNNFLKFSEQLLELGHQSKTSVRWHKKGRANPIWAECQGRIRTDEQGQRFLFLTLRDIDFQVQSETLLRQSERKHRLLFTRANDAIFIIKELEIVDCNEKTLSMFESPGYSGISGKKLYHFMPEMQMDGEDSILNFHYLVQAALDGEPQFFYWVFSKFSGEHFESEVSLSGFKLGDDDFVQVIVRDITARKKAEQEELRARLAEKANKELQREITERIQAQKELVQTQQFTASIIQSSLDLIVATDKESNVTEFNAAAQKAFGFEQEEVIGKNVGKLLFKEIEEAQNVLEAVLSDGYFFGEVDCITREQEVFPVYLSASVLLDAQGTNIGTVGVFKDISELKKTEQQLLESVEQKEVLIKEVHHRVKNNMQVINSILKLQSSYISDESALSAMHDCQERIKSMAFIHESLYQSNDLAKVNYDEYLRNLCGNLMFSYQPAKTRVELDLQVSGIALSLDTAISCGLIVNELISNALKYAFKGRKKGSIRVSLEKEGEEFELQVEDDGVGLPENFDYRQSKSLGFSLVHGLVDQIDGEIDFKSENGTKFIIKFKRT